MILLLFGSSSIKLISNKKYVFTGQKNYPSKRDGDVVVITVDYSPILASGETITKTEWKVGLVSGTDRNPNNMVKELSTQDGNKILQKIGGGITGNIYSPYCVATTSKGQVLSMPPSKFGLLAIES